MGTRRPDWQSRLSLCLAERLALPFAWGSQDCVLFAADCIEACTGVDLAAEHRGTYADERGAARVLKAVGGLSGLAARHLGAEVAPVVAQPGDVGLVPNEGRDCMAVCFGPGWYVPGGAGLVPFPLESASRAWRIGKED